MDVWTRWLVLFNDLPLWLSLAGERLYHCLSVVQSFVFVLDWVDGT